MKVGARMCTAANAKQKDRSEDARCTPKRAMRKLSAKNLTTNRGATYGGAAVEYIGKRAVHVRC